MFFTAGMIVSGFLMVGFSPIASTISQIYGCEDIVVQLQTLLFLIAFIPGNFMTIVFLNKYGLRLTVSAFQHSNMRWSHFIVNNWSRVNSSWSMA